MIKTTMSVTSVYLCMIALIGAGMPTSAGSSVNYQLSQRTIHSVTPHWRIGPPDNLPQDTKPQVDFLLLASAQSIDTAMQDAGWLQLTSAAEDTAASPFAVSVGQKLNAALTPQPEVIYLQAQPSGQSVDAIILWRVTTNDIFPAPLPAWQAEVFQVYAEDASPSFCRDLAHEAMAVFLEGEARILPATAAAKPAISCLELRHAAAEMRRMLALSADRNLADMYNGAVCPPGLLLPSPHRLDRPLPSTIFWHDGTTPKRVAITFDACSTFGHGDYNPAVIATLEALQVPATLFIGGHWAERHTPELQALAANPLFEIGNHSYSHPHMRDLSAEAQRQELLWTQEAIFTRTGVLPRFFRPPYGEVDDTLIRSVADAGLMTVEYDLPAGDADFHISDTRLIDWVVRKTSPGSIVIMHMNHPGNKTAEVLPAIIAALRARGLTLSTIGQMLAEGNP